MVFLKIRKNWAYAGSAPLLRTLLLHGAAYYFVLGLTFALQMVGSMNNKVGGHHSVAFFRPLPVGYSFTIPWWTPGMWRRLAKAHHSDCTNSFAISVGVVASNHLILSLREGANDRPILMEPLTSSSRPSTTGVVFAIQAPNTIPSYDDQSQTVSFPLSSEGYHRQGNLRWKLDT